MPVGLRGGEISASPATDVSRAMTGRHATSSESEDSRGAAGTHETASLTSGKGQGARARDTTREERERDESPVIGQRGTLARWTHAQDEDRHHRCGSSGAQDGA